MKTGIFYGSTTGVTQDISERVGKLLNADVMPASDIDKIKDEYNFKYSLFKDKKIIYSSNDIILVDY